MKNLLLAVIFALFIVAAPIIYWALTNPSNSLELMQKLRNTDHPESMFVDSKNVDYESINYIQKNLTLRASHNLHY